MGGRGWEGVGAGIFAIPPKRSHPQNPILQVEPVPQIISTPSFSLSFEVAEAEGDQRFEEIMERECGLGTGGAEGGSPQTFGVFIET